MPICLSIYPPKETIWKNLYEMQRVITGNEIIREFSILMFELLLNIIYYDSKKKYQNNPTSFLRYSKWKKQEAKKINRRVIFCYISSMKQGETKYTY